MQKIAEQHGLVISYFGSSVAVETETGKVVQCQLHRNQELPVVGDHVYWQMETAETGVVTRIEPRHSLLSRGDHHGKLKPIAANVDIIAIIMAPAPIFSEYLVDRYLIAAELLQIQPLIVLNKIDLLDQAASLLAEQRLLPYQHIPYPVILSSVVNQQGLQTLANALQDKTAVLVGPSGVGKSSIISALTGGKVIRTGDVSAKGAGKHTTTATRLYHLPQGGCLIDSPGVREFNLWSVSKQDILQGFKEFQPFLSGCKFRDCQHLVEPGCQVQAAVKAGKLSEKRYTSYQTLIKKI
jgi:ribosome biogenesis GTPase